jgi:hypothetical protein
MGDERDTGQQAKPAAQDDLELADKEAEEVKGGEQRFGSILGKKKKKKGAAAGGGSATNKPM